MFRPMTEHLTRRAVLVGGAALIVAACARQSRTGTDCRIPPTTALPPAPEGQGLWYDVAPGETLSQVSHRSGVSMEGIVRANHLTSIELSAGQRLWLPEVTALAPGSAAKSPIAELPPETPAPRGGYEVVPRSSWTQRPVGRNNNPMNGVLRITIHHTDEHAGTAGLPETEVISRIERYHRDERKWAAIGYHYLVGKGGHVYEGRPVQFQGAHVSGANEHNLGISMIGDFNRVLPNPTQLAALKAFLDAQRTRFEVPRNRVYGHRDLGASICPGDALYAWVKKYRAAAV